MASDVRRGEQRCQVCRRVSQPMVESGELCSDCMTSYRARSRPTMSGLDEIYWAAGRAWDFAWAEVEAAKAAVERTPAPRQRNVRWAGRRR